MMFEELCRNTGKLKKEAGQSDGVTRYTEYTGIAYFTLDRGEITADGYQVRTEIYIRDSNGVDPAGGVFVLSDGREVRIKTSERLYNVFDDVPEFWKLTGV